MIPVGINKSEKMFIEMSERLPTFFETHLKWSPGFWLSAALFFHPWKQLHDVSIMVIIYCIKTESLELLDVCKGWGEMDERKFILS